MMATADRRPQDATAVQGEQLDALALQVELSSVLGDLQGLVPHLLQLTTTHPRGLGYVTHAGRLAMGKQHQEEKQVARDNARLGFPAPSGDKPAPGNLTPVSAHADLTMRLIDAGHKLTQALLLQGDVCPATRLSREATNTQLLDYLLDLQRLVRHLPTLTKVTADLTEIRDRVSDIVDGQARVSLRELWGPDAVCPHCHRPTLVLYGRDVIVCEEDTRTGEKHPPCTCSDVMCECKSRPRAFRHTWYRDPRDERRGTASTWHHLAARLKGAVELKTDRRKKKPQPTTTEEPPSS